MSIVRLIDTRKFDKFIRFKGFYKQYNWMQINLLRESTLPIFRSSVEVFVSFNVGRGDRD